MVRRRTRRKQAEHRGSFQGMRGENGDVSPETMQKLRQKQNENLKTARRFSIDRKHHRLSLQLLWEKAVAFSQK